MGRGFRGRDTPGLQPFLCVFQRRLQKGSERWHLASKGVCVGCGAGFDADPTAKGCFPPGETSPAQQSLWTSAPPSSARLPNSLLLGHSLGPSVGAPQEGTEEGEQGAVVSASTLLGCAEGLGAVRGAGPSRPQRPRAAMFQSVAPSVV